MSTIDEHAELSAAEARAWLEAAAEWEREAVSSDRTRPRRAPLGGADPIAPCGCTSLDDRECSCWVARSESGSVCLCLFHERDAADLET